MKVRDNRMLLMIGVFVCLSRGVPTNWHPAWVRSTIPLGLASTCCRLLGLRMSTGLPSVSGLSLRSLSPPTQLVVLWAGVGRSCRRVSRAMWGQNRCGSRGSIAPTRYGKRFVTCARSLNASLRAATARWMRSLWLNGGAGAVSATESISCPDSAASNRRSRCVRVVVRSVLVASWLACCRRAAAVSALANPRRS
eukprot:258167-Prorocentrum_minimum.AAC.1